MDIPFGDELFLMRPESDLLEEAYLDLKLLLCVSMLLIKRENYQSQPMWKRSKGKSKPRREKI